MNLAPDLFRCVVADVPFVDALTTMLDATLPLTVGEWEEWGNPDASATAYRTMKGYSPTTTSSPRTPTARHACTRTSSRRVAERPARGILGTDQVVLKIRDANARTSRT